MRNLFIIHEDGEPVSTNNLAEDLHRFLHGRGIRGSAQWYYDEFAEPGPEYGVRVDMTDTYGEKLDELLKDLDDFIAGRPEALHIQHV